MKSLVSFRLPQEIPADPCVYRLEAGKKFFIWKTPDLSNLKSLAKDMDRKIQAHSLPETDPFYGLATYMAKYRVYTLHITVLFSTSDVDKLIDFERETLLEAFTNTDCVNSSFEPYLPKWVKEALNKPIKTIKEDETSDLSKPERKSIVEPKTAEKIKVNEKEQALLKNVLPKEKNLPVQMPDFGSLIGALSDLKK